MTIYTSNANDRLGKTSGHKRIEYDFNSRSYHGCLIWSVGLVALAILAYCIYMTF